MGTAEGHHDHAGCSGHDHGPGDGHAPAGGHPRGDDHGPGRGGEHDHAHGGEHDHDHGHAHGGLPRRSGPPREEEARRLVLTLLVSLVATFAEGLGGWLSHSLALLSDAVHLLADVAAIALSLFAVKVASRPADARRTYGWYRLEILVALVNGAALIAIAAFIAVEALHRLREPETVEVGLVVKLALLGVALNGVGLWLTHGGEHASMNLRSTFLHLAGDLLNSVGVLLAALIVHFTGWQQADPVISLLIAGTIVWSAIRLCREAVDVLLEAFPSHLDFGEVTRVLSQVDGVRAVHDLHVWTITSGMVSLSCHIVVSCAGPGCRSHDEILTDAKAALRRSFSIDHTTIQFESDQYRHDEVVH
jgi:cobalt-zinc-cadmium efflux system protein